MDLNTRIEKIINYSMLSASEFAEEIGVQRSNISHILSGRNKPSLDFIIKIKERFPEIQWEWIIEGKGDMTLLSSPTPKESIITENKKKQLLDLFNTLDDKENDNFVGFPETKTKETKTVDNSPKLDIDKANENKKDISDSQSLDTTESSNITDNTDNQINKIKKIVFFYENGKFEIFEQ